MAFLSFITAVLFGILMYPLSFLLLGKTFGEIVFYRGLIHAALIGFLQYLILWPALTRLPGLQAAVPTRQAKRLMLLSIVALALSFNVTFLIVFPVTFDRSVTTYLLEELERRETSSVPELEASLINDYTMNRKAVQRRMREQELSGNVKSDGGRVTLTGQGKTFMKFSRLVRRLFKIEARIE